jgi:rhodanese-related sulfurtransferase
MLFLVILALSPGILGGCSKGGKVQEAAKPPTAQELLDLINSGTQDFLLVDTRTPQEYASGHIPGAVLIPYDEISKRLNEIPKDKKVILYCRTGRRSGIALRTLQENGYTNAVNFGGIKDWPFEVVQGDSPWGD